MLFFQPLLRDSPEAFLLMPDIVQDKRCSRFIDVARRSYSSNAHSMVTGVGLANLVYSSRKAPLFAFGLPRLRARLGRAAENRPFPGPV